MYIEPLMRVNRALHDRGLITNSSILIHAAVSNTHGLAPFYEYAGESGVASSLTTVDEKMIAREKDISFVGTADDDKVPLLLPI